jgi:glycosyltransferase involved in cell wall biosynthesis
MKYLGSDSQKTVIHQFHYSVAPGDAITNQMLFVQEALWKGGVESRVFAWQIRGGLAKYISRFSEAALWGCDLLLVHHSHGNPLWERLSRIEVPKVLVYHNITPEQFFRHDPHMERFSRLGRRQLKRLARNVVAVFADSEFNALELRELGCANPLVFPLFDLTELRRNMSANPGKDNGSTRLLFVGKIAPHKNQALLVKALAFLPQKYRLTLVGSADPIYLDYLKLLAKRLVVHERVEFPGKVPGDVLRRTYARSNAFVCVSAHEGFCVPLVEAMCSSIPVFAIDSGAVVETLGSAGVLLKSQKPWEIAEVIRLVLERPSVVRKILKGQTRRLEELSVFQSAEAVRQSCRDMVHKLRVIPPCAWERDTSKGAAVSIR